MRRLLQAVLALALMGPLGGCSVFGGPGTGTYRLTAYFTKAPSLYEKSRVKVMGANVGTIDGIEVDRATQQVKVTMSVRSDVPVPADAHAAILAANTIGERNIVLYPPWKPGTARIAPGAVIPRERTDLPIEIDDALAAFTTLSRSIEPERLREVFKDGAGLLRGNGQEINDALQGSAISRATWPPRTSGSPRWPPRSTTWPVR